MTSLWGESHCPAKDERVGSETGVEPQCAVHGRDTHLVAVVLHTCHHTRHNPARVQHTHWQVAEARQLRSKAQHVRIGNRFGRYAQHVPDHAAYASVRPAERLNRRRVVVSFHLERHFELVVEVNDTGVVHKCRAHPGSGDFIGGGFQVGLEKRVNFPLIHTPFSRGERRGNCDLCLERFMPAVLGPGLGDGFEFDVGRVAAFGLEVGLDGFHLVQIQCGAA